MHASLFTDSIGSFLGKVINVRREGDQVVGDLSFAQSSRKTRYNDLADYIMTMASETPDMLGASIEFQMNTDEMQEFVKQNGGVQFKSPDPMNINNYPHVRLHNISAVAIVDQPAANPMGLFASVKFSEIHNEIEKIANFIKMQVQNKKEFGILKELAKMNIKLEQVKEQTKAEEMPKVQVKLEQVKLQIAVEQTKVQEVKIEQPVVQAKIEQVKTQEVKVEQTAPVVLSADKQEVEKLKAMVQILQAEFNRQKELINFAKGTSPVAPIVKEEQFKSAGYKQKFEKALGKKK